jgi:hypothetical protein
MYIHVEVALGRLLLGVYLEHLGDVAGAEDLVYDGELVGIVGGEEGREDAVLGAPPPQQLARRARRPAAHIGIPVTSYIYYRSPEATTTTGSGNGISQD